MAERKVWDSPVRVVFVRGRAVCVREVKARKSATTCGQCGKAYPARACGPTHAMMAVKPRKSGKGKVKRGR